LGPTSSARDRSLSGIADDPGNDYDSRMQTDLFLVYDGVVEEAVWHRLDEIGGVRTLECFPNGEQIQTDRDAIELISAALQHRAEMIVVPVERLSPEFFQLRTGVAGDIVQKFVQYRRRLVIVGDIAPYVTKSSAFGAFVIEANRGGDVWFLPNRYALESGWESAKSCATKGRADR